MKFFVKFSLLLILLLLGLKSPAFAQLDFAVEFNVGYDLILPASSIGYEPDDYAFGISYSNIPFGVSLSMTTSPIVSFGADFLYEYRWFTRYTSFLGLEESFAVGLHTIRFPISLRFHLPLQIFLSVGFELSFAVGNNMDGVMFHYTNAKETTPIESEITPIDLNDVSNDIYFRDYFRYNDYSIQIGAGWRYYFSDIYYLMIRLIGSFSIVDLDRSGNYETFMNSIYILAGFGIDF